MSEQYEPVIDGENIVGMMIDGTCQDIPALPVIILFFAQKLFEIKSQPQWELAS